MTLSATLIYCFWTLIADDKKVVYTHSTPGSGPEDSLCAKYFSSHLIVFAARFTLGEVVTQDIINDLETYNEES